MNDAAGTLIVGAGLAGSAARHAPGRDGRARRRGGRSGPRRRAQLLRAQRRRRARDLVAARERGAVRRDDRLLRRAPRGAGLPRARLPLAPRARALAARPRRTCRCRTASAARWSCSTPAEVRRRWPFIDQLDGIAGATFSPKDGLVTRTPSASTTASRARAAGAVFLDRLLVTGVRRDGDRVTGVELRELDGGDGGRGGPGGRRRRPGRRAPVACERMVNAAGPLGGARGRPDRAPRCPAAPCPASSACWPRRDVDLSRCGMIVDTSDVYFHHEAGELFLAGLLAPGRPAGLPLRLRGARPSSSARSGRGSPRGSRPSTAWSTCAAGPASTSCRPTTRPWSAPWRGSRTLYEIHSFSGRGVMQSYAAALSLAELITTGAYRTFPAAAALAGSRFRAGALQPEELHI